MKNVYKSLLLIFFIIYFSLFSNFKNIKISAYNLPKYAQINNSNTYLYKSAIENEDILNKWCLIENSYFVKILNNFNNVYYKVEYNNLIGYVKKNSINLINEKPNMPYPNNLTFDIYHNADCYLRKSPKIKDITNNVICTIPHSYKNLKFIGKTLGEEAIDCNGYIWYLTEYNNQIGYVYSKYTTNLSAIEFNHEIVTAFKGDDLSNINPLSNPMCVFLIILMLIPCLFIIVLIYLPIKQVKHNNNDNKIKTKKSIKYYDENL